MLGRMCCRSGKVAMAPLASCAERIQALALSASAGVSLDTGLGAFGAFGPFAAFAVVAPAVAAAASEAMVSVTARARLTRFTSGHLRAGRRMRPGKPAADRRRRRGARFCRQ